MSNDDGIYSSEDDDDDLSPLRQPLSEKNRARAAKRKIEAQERIARREKLNIRFSEEEIQSIYAAAERNHTPVMPMLRKWVLAALAQDEAESKRSGSTAQTRTPASSKLSVSEGTARYQSDAGGFTENGSPSIAKPSASVLESKLGSIETALNQLASALHDAGFRPKID
ncbi:MAG: hypothetical protein SGJ27_10010 [Candidatus Melainabacteria bacterium]|nr:hypothetical protein [Candidatus Melainabacteria bacterium]